MTRRKPWHPSNPYPRTRKALADRPLYPFADRASALRIVAESTAEVAEQQAREIRARARQVAKAKREKAEARRRARLGLARWDTGLVVPTKDAGKTASAARHIKAARAKGKGVLFVVPSKGTRRKR